jgi:hypothetical protein
MVSNALYNHAPKPVFASGEEGRSIKMENFKQETKGKISKDGS